MFSRLFFLRKLATGPAIKYGGVVPNKPGYKRIQELQNIFCRDDGLLVWQKMGKKDEIMYYGTIAVATLGFIPAFYIIFSLAFPSKK